MVLKDKTEGTNSFILGYFGNKTDKQAKPFSLCFRRRLKNGSCLLLLLLCPKFRALSAAAVACFSQCAASLCGYFHCRCATNDLVRKDTEVYCNTTAKKQNKTFFSLFCSSRTTFTELYIYFRARDFILQPTYPSHPLLFCVSSPA